MASQMVKLLIALDLLRRPTGATIKEMMEGLGVSRKGVYRQFERIEELTVPLYDDKATGETEKRWRIDADYVKKFPNFTVPGLDLSLPEIIALYLLKGQAGLYQDTEVQTRVDSAFKKLSHLVPGSLFKQLDKISSLFLPTSKFSKDYAGKEEIIDRCFDAMLQQKTCYVQYHSFSDDLIKNFKIDPLCYFESNGGLYVFVRTTSFNEIRILAVERIKSLEMTESTFEHPQDFQPGELLDSAFDIVYDDPIEVNIWFSEGQARYIKERTWASWQEITDQPDGSINLHIKTSGWWHVKKWVLSFGADARVIEPEELRDDIVQELTRTRNGYQ